MATEAVFHSVMGSFRYVCMLESNVDSKRHYVGITNHLAERLRQHNKGSVPSSAPMRPWRIKTAVAFTDSERAAEFERYLQSASGRAFAIKHF